MTIRRLIDEHELGIASALLGACLLLGLCIGYDLKLQRDIPNREFVVATDHSPPFQILHSDGRVSGAMVEALNRAAERLHIKLRWRAVKGGPDAHLGVDPSVDLWPFVMRLPERKDRFYIAQTFANATYILASAKPLSESVSRFVEGKRIAIRDVPHFRSEFKKLYPGSMAVPLKEVDDVLLAACNGEVAGAITEPSQLQDFLLRNRQNCKGGPLQISGIPNWRVPLSIGSTFANAPVADALRAELGAMAREHELDSVFAQYQPLSIFRDADTYGETELELSMLRALNLLLLLAGLSAFLGMRVLRLRRTAARAVRLADDRFRYLADMSHELRTPLNGILGMANLLHDAKLSPTHRDYLKVIELSGNELLALINNVLDLAKLDRRGAATQIESVSTRELAGNLLSMFVPVLQARGIESVLAVDSSVPDRIHIDAAKFRQIFVNLTGNAVKFTAKGFVHIRIRCVEFPSSDRHLRVEIADSGPGISEADQDKLFRAFEQTAAGRDTTAKGTGLGLEISKRLACFAGGRVGMSSVLGQGSTFWFELPMEPDPETSLPQVAGQNAIHARLALNGKRIAIAGGHPVLHAALSEDLARFGADVRSYPNLSDLPGREAPLFDTILLDYDSLVAHGEAVVEDLEALHEASSADLIALCNGTQAAGIVEGWKAPWLRTALKPVNAIDLARMREDDRHTGSALKNLAKAVSDTSPQPGLTALPKSASTADRLRILVAEDNPVNRMVIKAIIERLGHEGTIATNGQHLIEALERDLGYSLILMDCNMPGLDGFETSRRIRERFGKDNLPPIVAVTANSVEDVYTRCIDSGMNDAVSKPVTAELLQSVFKRYAVVRHAG
ncbi:MAG: response regulator [Bryobacterales bacterium]|nr:response regulator [Bryobacterales bacterium]